MNRSLFGNGNPNTGAALVKDWALRANRGVQLTRSAEHGLTAQPMGPNGQPDPQSCALSPMPAHILEKGCSLLRHLWRTRSAVGVWWLYFHPKQRRWWSYCPPQSCTGKDVRVDETFKDCPTPDPELWLAGSLQSASRDMQSVVEAEMPLFSSHQGVHFVLDLTLPLTCLSAFLRVGTDVEAAPAARWIDDPLDPSLTYLLDRMQSRQRN